MKKPLVFSFFILVFITYVFFSSSDSSVAQKHIPSYAKWGRLALIKTKEKYPTAKVVDYFHIGNVKGHQSSVEKFKLWLKENKREFGVFVNIRFENETERVINITFQQTST
jgi:hypothetical protein